IIGQHLDGTNRVVVLSNARFQIEQEVPAVAGTSGTAMQFVVPDLPVGIYQLAVRVTRPEESDFRISNQLALVIGPQITTSLPVDVIRDGAGTATITLDCQPEVRSGQRVSLLLDAREVFPQPFAVPTATLTFVVTAASMGDLLARLRVDGIESPLIDYEAA